MRTSVLKIFVLSALFFLAFLTVGCKAKKVSDISTRIDSVTVNKIVTITPASLSQIKIESPCDSLGNLRPFSFYNDTGKTKTKIFTKHDTIFVEVKNDSIKDSSTTSDSVSIKNDAVTYEKTVTPRWAYWVLIYSVILSTLFILFIRK